MGIVEFQISIIILVQKYDKSSYVIYVSVHICTICKKGVFFGKKIYLGCSKYCNSDLGSVFVMFLIEISPNSFAGSDGATAGAAISTRVT